jgi:catechol 2,3-dioxygenase-like lactoylglutathione lyase family enzyme
MPRNIIGSNVICQVGIIVRDIERTARAYAELFGVQVPPVHLTAPREVAHTVYRGRPTDARAKLAFFDMGAVSLELIEPVGGPSTWREFIDRVGEGVHHIAFQIKDTDGVVRQLEARGMPAVQQGDYTGGRYTYVGSEAALAVVLELLESAKA